MLRAFALLLVFAAVSQPARVSAQSSATTPDAPTYTADHKLMLPAHYREWIFLTSGIDMSYSPNPAMAGHSMFDNVFVNPSSYQAYLKTGTWPDKTTFILEVRGAEGPSSINKRGHTQSQNIMGFEIHVKDSGLEGGWGFFEPDGPATAALIKRPAACYQCHEAHGAVDTTFVQFYPTLFRLAKQKNTLSPAYLKEISAPVAPK